MRGIDIRIGDKFQHDQPLFPEFREPPNVPFDSELIAVGILEAGMESGLPSLWFVSEDNGVKYSFQMSYGQFDGVASALRGAMARWEERDRNAG